MKEERKKESSRWLEILLFTVYLAMLCYFLFFSESLGRNYSERAYHYNLMPFKEIRRFWMYRRTLGFWSVFLNLVGNVAAFIPFGIFLPRLFQRCESILMTALFSFELSLCVEVIQLAWKVGSFDVDDILLNTLGGIAGYLIYRILAGVSGRTGARRGGKHEKKKSL